MFLRLFFEGFSQSLGQLAANKLRTFLSLLGITIGIFCIIAVLSAVDSLEDNIKGSFEKLGNDVLYVTKMPWNEDPDENYFKYLRRPNASYKELEAVKVKVKNASLVALQVFIGGASLKYKTNSIRGSYAMAVSYDYNDIFKIEYEKGRFLTPFEYEAGEDKVVIGSELATNLFNSIDPIGKNIKIKDRYMEVVGVIKKSGKDLINPADFDRAVLIGYNTAKKLVPVRNNRLWGTNLMVKAAKDANLEDLKAEVTSVLKAERRQKPYEQANFSINEMSILTNLLDKFFGVLNLVGIVIGLFAIIVGMFSVANIMFVSVKERTNIIGIKKALGARQFFILLEFLIEAVVLCVLGGLFGLGLVYLILKILSSVFGYTMFLSIQNIMIGVSLSVFIGILSGLIPALQAARMDPVEAIRK
ncbi:MAG: ABC transporter permease [Saprospiraceae bacterium]